MKPGVEGECNNALAKSDPLFGGASSTDPRQSGPLYFPSVLLKLAACLTTAPPSEKVTANAGLPTPPHASAALADTTAAASETESLREGYPIETALRPVDFSRLEARRAIERGVRPRPWTRMMVVVVFGRSGGEGEREEIEVEVAARSAEDVEDCIRCLCSAGAARRVAGIALRRIRERGFPLEGVD